MNVEEIKLWLALAGALFTLLSFLGGWLLWSLRQAMVPRHEFDGFQEEHDKDHDQLEKRLEQGELRFANFEASIKSLPTREEMQTLRIDIERLHGSINKMSATLDAVKGPLETIIHASVEKLVGDRKP